MIEPSLRLRRAIHANDPLLVSRILKTHPSLLQNPDFSPTGLSNTSLHLAASLGHLEIVKLLLQLGHEGIPLPEKGAERGTGNSSVGGSPLPSPGLNGGNGGNGNGEKTGMGLSRTPAVKGNRGSRGSLRKEERESLRQALQITSGNSTASNPAISSSNQDPKPLPLFSTTQTQTLSPPNPSPEKHQLSISLNEHHQTPLHLSSLAGHTEISHLLSTLIPSYIPRRDYLGRDAIMNASEKGHDTIVQILLTAVQKGDVEGVTMEGVLANADVDGNTALHFASMNGCLLVLRTLLAAGADSERRNCWSWRAGDYSATKQTALILSSASASASASS